jgi:hypothetical protein
VAGFLLELAGVPHTECPGHRLSASTNRERTMQTIVCRLERHIRLPIHNFHVLALAVSVFASPSAWSALCSRDIDCSDHVFCNGEERCMPGAPGADARGCIPPISANPCLAGQTCNEAAMRCLSPPRIDRDKDGHASIETGGDDCDDEDANNFPGNLEIWDAADHNEDCNVKTHGVPPGFGPAGRIGPIQVCSGEGYVVLTGTVGGEESFRAGTCNGGMVCVAQPSGDGFCLPRPPGYAAPPVLQNIPLGDQQMKNQRPAQPRVQPVAGPAVVAPPVFAAPPGFKALPSVAPIQNLQSCPPGMVADPETKKCVARR